MRWKVQGTDSATGKKLSLSLQEDSATAAVQAALGKGIVVSQVARASRVRMISMVITVLCTLVVIFGGACALLRGWEEEAREQGSAALAEEARLASALSDSGETIAALQRRTAALEEAHGGAARKLLDELQAARSEATELAGKLAAAKTRIAELEKTSVDIKQLKDELAAAQGESQRLGEQLREQRGRLAELDKIRAAAGTLEKNNRELAGQIDTLRDQLLEQAAKSAAVPVIQAADPPMPAPGRTRWAMRVSYDAASDFQALHFGRDTLASAAAGEGAVSTSGVSADSSATLKLVHDAEKTRLYSATLAVSLTADGPKERIAANQKMLADFLRLFAGSLKEPDAWAAQTIKQLADKNGAERAVRLGDDFKLTVWNDGQGLYSWRVESPRADMDE